MASQHRLLGFIVHGYPSTLNQTRERGFRKSEPGFHAGQQAAQAHRKLQLHTNPSTTVEQTRTPHTPQLCDRHNPSGSLKPCPRRGAVPHKDRTPHVDQRHTQGLCGHPRFRQQARRRRPGELVTWCSEVRSQAARKGIESLRTDCTTDEIPFRAHAGRVKAAQPRSL